MTLQKKLALILALIVAAAPQAVAEEAQKAPQKMPPLHLAHEIKNAAVIEQKAVVEAVRVEKADPTDIETYRQSNGDVVLSGQTKVVAKADIVINGNMTFSEQAQLDMNGFNLTVNGALSTSGTQTAIINAQNVHVNAPSNVGNLQVGQAVIEEGPGGNIIVNAELELAELQNFKIDAGQVMVYKYEDKERVLHRVIAEKAKLPLYLDQHSYKKYLSPDKTKIIMPEHRTIILRKSLVFAGELIIPGTSKLVVMPQAVLNVGGLVIGAGAEVVNNDPQVGAFMYIMVNKIQGGINMNAAAKLAVTPSPTPTPSPSATPTPTPSYTPSPKV